MLHGADVSQASMYGRGPGIGRAEVVNGGAGPVSFRDGTTSAVLAFTVVDSRSVAIDILADPDRLAQLELAGIG